MSKEERGYEGGKKREEIWRKKENIGKRGIKRKKRESERK